MTDASTTRPSENRTTKQRLRDAVDARPVAAFSVLAYAFSWVLWLPAVLGAERAVGTLSFVAGGFGPALAGAVVTWLDGESVRAWARQIVRWRVAPRWYLAALGLPRFVETRTRESAPAGTLGRVETAAAAGGGRPVLDGREA